MDKDKKTDGVDMHLESGTEAGVSAVIQMMNRITDKYGFKVERYGDGKYLNVTVTEK